MNTVKVIPLGGYAEVGKNMTAVEYGNDIVIIDAGLMFPEDRLLGVDFVIPDISYLLENKDKVRAILVTHGHEDHIGALPYVLPELRVPVFATRLTKGLISNKLKERRLLNSTEVNVVDTRDVLSLGEFEVEFYRVNHSIPDAVGIAVHTPAGTIVHSGDFKIDQTPVDGLPTDFAKLVELGQGGVIAFICDCVRVERGGHSPSERTIAETFDIIFRRARGRIIVTTFASNISRVQQIIDAAREHGRKVAVVGRSLESNAKVAIELGYLSGTEGVLMRLDELRGLPHEQIVFVTTGSQGEPTSVLSRIATNEHRSIRLVPGDTVIMSSSPIPGNEETVMRTVDNLFRLGADVIYSALANVHVSGHASQEDLKLVLNLLRPQYCVPFHGEYRHMVLFRRVAEEVGIQSEQALLAAVGQVLEFSERRGTISGRVPAGSVFVDGTTTFGEMSQVVLRDRRQLSRDGVVIVVVALDRQSGRLVVGPDVVSRGFLYPREPDDVLESAKETLRAALDHGAKLNVEVEFGFVTHKVKEVLSEYLYEQTGRRPLILPVVTEV